MANPGELNEIWASDPTNAVIDTPPDALESAGWSAGQPPTAAHVNYLFNKASSWWSYLTAALDDAASVFYFKAPSTFTSLRLHMVGGVNAWLEIDKTTGEFNLQHGSGATNCLKVTADGLKGPTAVASASTGIRYGYPSGSPLVCVLDVSPGANGYTLSIQPGVTVNLNSGVFWVSNNSGGADGFTAVFGLGLLGVAAHLTAPVQAVSLSGNFTSLANTNVICRLIERVRSTGSTSVLLEIESTSASVTDNNGGTPIALDPHLNQYYIQIVSNGNIPDTGTSDQIELLTLTLNRFAVQ